jgi:hypothetical protein
MDIWVYLTNGNVAPLTGVTAVEEIKDYTSNDDVVQLSSVAWAEGKVSKITVASTTGVIPGMMIQAEGTIASSTQKASLPVGTRALGVASSTEIIIDPPFTNPPDAPVSGGVGVAVPDPESYVESGYYREPTDSTPDATTGTTIPPRQLHYRENLWKFTCTVDAETVSQYFRKSQVIGWGNSEPQF